MVDGKAVSENRNVLSAVITERASSFGDPVRNLRSGRRFTAEIEAVQDIEANVLLGRDARESCIFHVADRAVARGILMQDELEALGERFSVLRRTDNPASPQVEFGLMKLSEKDE